MKGVFHGILSFYDLGSFKFKLNQHSFNHPTVRQYMGTISLTLLHEILKIILLCIPFSYSATISDN